MTIKRGRCATMSYQIFFLACRFWRLFGWPASLLIPALGGRDPPEVVVPVHLHQPHPLPLALLGPQPRVLGLVRRALQSQRSIRLRCVGCVNSRQGGIHVTQEMPYSIDDCVDVVVTSSLV